jgi:O-methyltransferase involved in polyketide biosynthesis
MRTDNDTWDITTSVGSTALFVAAARALEAKKPDPLAVDPYAELFCRAVGGQWADVLDGVEDDGPAYSRLRSDFGEFFVNFQAARTKYFDAYFNQVADAGVRQIVLLAAGLDSRAYRLPWPDGTVVFELDQPRVLEFKGEVLARHGGARGLVAGLEGPRFRLVEAVGLDRRGAADLPAGRRAATTFQRDRRVGQFGELVGGRGVDADAAGGV